MSKPYCTLLFALSLTACNFAIEGVAVEGPPPAAPATSTPSNTPVTPDDGGTVPPAADAAPVMPAPDLAGLAPTDCRVAGCSKPDEICCQKSDDQSYSCQKGSGSGGGQCGD